MSVGKRIREERERLGHTREEWSSHVGVHLNTQLKYERGDSEPDISYLSKVEELGADYTYIVTGERASVVDRTESLNRECSIVFNVVEDVEKYLESSGLKLTPQRKARAISILFRLAYPTGIVDPNTIHEVVSLAE